MKRAVLDDHALLREAYETFKNTIDSMAATFTARVVKREPPSRMKIEGGEVYFDLGSLIMTRKELEAFDEKRHWQKILDVCKQYGFSPVEVETG